MDSWTVDKMRKKMNRHFYSLQRYAGISSRYTCPSCGKKHCFSLYVDEAGTPIDECVGRCDHESSCGYHVKPVDWFRDHPETNGKDWRTERPSWLDKALAAKKQKPICTIPIEFVNRSVLGRQFWTKYGAFFVHLLFISKTYTLTWRPLSNSTT